MKWALSLFTTLLLVFFWSCTTRDGNIVRFSPEFGSIFVTSTNAFGARIFLDYQDTGATTPAQLQNISIGRHTIHLFLSQHQPTPDSFVVEVKPGKQTTVSFELNKVASGDLEIISHPDSATIRINKLNFGMTPETVLGLVPGGYTVEIRKGSYQTEVQQVAVSTNQLQRVEKTLSVRRLVLLEHFSNTSCLPCPIADAIIEKVLAEKGVQTVASLGYHASYPSNNDPMYLAAREDVDARLTFYSFPPMPRLIVNGIEISFFNFDQLEIDLRNLIQSQSQLAPDGVVMQILDFQNDGDNISGRVRMEALADLSASNKLHIGLIERNVEFDQPPGSNGQQQFIDVFRGFSTPPDGERLALSRGQKRTVPFNFKRQPDWGTDLEAVAFIQEEGTHKILQSAWSVYP